ncbi:hypothetical protein ACJJTC_005597 [Scirpophaga incertulas]
MYVVVQFEDKDQGEGLGLVLSKWITPRKSEVFWPPVKEQYKFDKLLKQNEEPDREKWATYGISRCFYETEINSEVSNCLLTPIKSIPQAVATTSSLQLSTKLTSLKRTAPLKSNYDDNVCNSDITIDTTPISSNINFRNHESDFQKKILDTLITIREQNKELCAQNREIISLLKKNQDNVGPQISFTLPKLPVGLPLQSETDIHELEIHLSSDSNLTRLGAYLASIGGKTLASRTYGVLKQLLSDNVASGYNFYGVGKNNKKAFSKLTLTKLILCKLLLEITIKYDAVKVGYSQATDA